MRVQQWQEKLLPVLEVEEQRPPFDIHVYGNAVIESMKWRIDQARRERSSSDNNHDDMVKVKQTSIVDFRHVVEGCDSYEVCRRFLATLSLNNSSNVRFLDQQKDTSGAVVCSSSDSLKVELLSSDIERPMENYIAPSLHQEAES